MALLGQYDESKMQFYTEAYDLGIGDLPYDLTPLTEPGFSARGAKGEFRLNQFKFGGYAAKTRMTKDDEKQIGAFIDYTVKGENRISLNYLSKRVEDDAFHLWSLNSD